MLKDNPVADGALIDNDALVDFEWMQSEIDGVRNIRGEMYVSPGKKVPAIFTAGEPKDKAPAKVVQREGSPGRLDGAVREVG